jgi:hypothetical protein
MAEATALGRRPQRYPTEEAPVSDRRHKQDTSGRKKQGKSGEPARSRTENQQIKSLLLCQLSYGPSMKRAGCRTFLL